MVDQATPAQETLVRPPDSASSKFSKKSILLTTLIVVLIAGSTYGSYLWQHQKVKDLSLQLSTLKIQSAPISNANQNTKFSSAFVTNVGISYPLSLPHKEVLTTLYLPAGNNVVQTDIYTTGQDELAANYTESYNDVIANWEFTDYGTLEKPSPSSANSSIRITALNDWMSTNDPSAVNYGEPEGGAKTKAQKSTFVADLKNETASCAGDKSKGFTTKDKIYNICYSLQHPQGEGGEWLMNLSGYADISGTKAYLRGVIYLPNETYQSVSQRHLQALKNISTTVKINPKNP